MEYTSSKLSFDDHCLTKVQANRSRVILKYYSSNVSNFAILKLFMQFPLQLLIKNGTSIKMYLEILNFELSLNLSLNISYANSRNSSEKTFIV